MRSKLASYIGFAVKSRNLLMGFNTCVLAMEKRRIKGGNQRDLGHNSCQSFGENIIIIPGNEELHRKVGQKTISQKRA